MNRTVLKGCGIGCGVVALLFLVLVGGGAWFAREMGREYKIVQETEDALVGAHGGLADWSPPAGLLPEPERVAVFADVRAGTGEWRRQLEADIARFAAERDRGGIAGFWHTVRAGSDLGLTYARFWTARNRVLMDQGMGPAEYAWLYGQVYYAWLGHDPGAGADNLKFEPGQGGAVRVEFEAGRHDPVQDQRERMHDLLAPVVSLAEPGSGGGLGADELAAEAERLDLDPTRVPWQDGLPEALAAVFAPHREVLAAAWSEQANPLELMFDLQRWADEQEQAQKDR
ncbi:MAG: hypothetical protein R6X35_05405 [Candidatus Krumholzibacteriia bacterium]